MSFNDIDAAERGAPSRSRAADPGTVIHDRAFAALTQRISVQIFKLNANVKGINACVDALGSSSDSTSIRKKLTNLTDVTRELVKGSTEDVKQLAQYPTTDRQQKMEQAKVSRDFQTAIHAFQKAQRHSAEKQRQYVEQAKATLSDAHDSTSNASLTPRADSQLVELTEQRSPELEQQQQQQLQETTVSDAELEFQETLIEEREGEIREIEAGIVELNEIFRDLGTIVHEQQSMLDNIESNVISIANDTAGASTELTKAHAYQRRAGRRMLCLLLIFIFVLTVVLLAILL